MVLMQKNVVKGRKIWYNKGAYKCKKTTGIGVPMVFLHLYQVNDGCFNPQPK